MVRFVGTETCLVSADVATGTIAYTYDAQVRLVTAARTGAAGNDMQIAYQHDVYNRTWVTLSGSPIPPPPS